MLFFGGYVVMVFPFHYVLHGDAMAEFLRQSFEAECGACSGFDAFAVAGEECDYIDWFIGVGGFFFFMKYRRGTGFNPVGVDVGVCFE